MSPGFRTSQGKIVAVRKTPEGYLDVYCTFMEAGKLRYSNVDLGAWEEELLWENITDSNSIVTSSGKPITLGHPDTPNALMDASQWRQYGMGMTGQKIFLDHPFATIVCSIGAKELVDKIEYGDVTTVSSGRRSETYSKDGQIFQGKWEANHIAFIDSTKGQRGRAPHALVHYGKPPGHLTSRNAKGRVKAATYIIKCDSQPSEEYSFDLDKFQIDNERGIYIPIIDSTMSKKTTPIQLSPSAEPGEEEPNMDPKKTGTAIEEEDTMEDEETSADSSKKKKEKDTGNESVSRADMENLTTAVVGAIRQEFNKFGDVLKDAIKPADPKADSEPTPLISIEESRSLVEAATAIGIRRGEVLSIASELLPKADQAGLSTMSTTDLCVKSIAQINPAMSVDANQPEEVLCAVLKTAKSMVPKADSITEEIKPEYKGKEVPESKPKEAKADSTEGDASEYMMIIEAAYKKQEAALSK